MIIKELKQQLADIQQRINSIQLACSHPAEASTRVGHSNTGNYDPTCDEYWWDYHCALCDKQWSTPQ